MDETKGIPIERRSTDRRRQNVAVYNDRRDNDRRAGRLAPSRSFAGVAVIVDTWPLMRAGIRLLLEERGFRVAADAASVGEVMPAVGDRLDLAVLGSTHEVLPEAVEHLRRMPGPTTDGQAAMLLLMERVELGELRHLLSMGVHGIVQRSIGMEDLAAACERVLAGHRVLSGGPMSVLASAGLEVAPDAGSPFAPRDGAGLTRKELEVLSHLARHQSNKEIAENMHLSAATVKTHLSNIYSKLEVSGRREAIVASVQRGLLT